MSGHPYGGTAAGGRPAARRTRLPWVALLPVLLALAACAGAEGDMSQQDLSLACEMHKCDCAPDGDPFKAGAGVLWQLDGSAYCPKSYHLRMLDLPPSSKMVI